MQFILNSGRHSPVYGLVSDDASDYIRYANAGGTVAAFHGSFFYTSYCGCYLLLNLGFYWVEDVPVRVELYNLEFKLPNQVGRLDVNSEPQAV